MVCLVWRFLWPLLFALLGTAQPDAISGEGADWTTSSTFYVLNHRQALVTIFDGIGQEFFHTDKSNAECFTNNIAGLEEEARVAIIDIVVAFEDLFHGDIQDMTTKVATIIEAYQKLFRSWDTLVNGCMANERDVLDTLLENVQSLSFIGGQLKANGMDVVEQVSEAIIDFHDHKFNQFGRDIGLSMRKIFLSHADTPPEGPPSGNVLLHMTAGLVDGFFGAGTQLILVGQDGENKVIDLHKCVKENEGFFMGAWELAWKFFANLAAGGWKQVKEKSKSWEEGLIVLIVGAPVAFKRCGVDPKQQAMLRDVAQHLTNLTDATNGVALDHALKVNPHAIFTDGTGFDRGEVQVELAKAIEFFSKEDWKLFGRHLGKLVQELVMLVVPQQYSLDESGRLQRTLGLDSEDHSASDFGRSAGMVLLICSLLSAVVAFSWRYHRRSAYVSCSGQHCAGTSRRDVEIHEMMGDEEFIE